MKKDLKSSGKHPGFIQTYWLVGVWLGNTVWVWRELEISLPQLSFSSGDLPSLLFS
jgi:hypothetical protein